VHDIKLIVQDRQTIVFILMGRERERVLLRHASCVCVSKLSHVEDA
jgi:predicted nucleic acid-binding Zn finger protein